MMAQGMVLVKEGDEDALSHDPPTNTEVYMCVSVNICPVLVVSLSSSTGPP